MHASDESKTGSVGLEPIKLIEPKLERDTSLAEAFRARRTVREFSDEALSPQTLSDLLWAACGINRLGGPFGVVGRTAASASNSQEIDVYVAPSEGTYLYDPAPHILVPVAASDFRRFALAARQAPEAPTRPSGSFTLPT